jgi:phage tail sheath protein FI
LPTHPTYPGVYIEEIPSGVRTITGVSTSVAAFLGAARRGPINFPVHIFSFTDFERTFGGLTAGSEMSYAVRQFFLNGGSECWIVRVATNVVAATRVLLSSAAAQVLDVTSVDGGAAGNDIQIAVDYATSNPSSTFNLTVTYQSADQPGRPVIEKFGGLSMNANDAGFVESVINGSSSLVTVARHAGIVFAGQGKSVSAAATDLSGLNAQHNQLQVALDGGTPITIQLTSADIAGGLTAIAVAIQTQVRAGTSDAANKAGFVCAANTPAAGQLTLTSVTNGEKSSVRALSGARNDAAATLKLGTANGGVETDAASAFRPKPLPDSATLTGGVIAALTGFPSAAANSFQISLDGNGPDTVIVPGPALAAGPLGTQLAAIAALITTQVRALRPSIAAYKNFTATPGANNLILASGSSGTGSTIVVSPVASNDIAATLQLTGVAGTAPLNANLQGGHDDPFTDATVYSAFVPSPATRGGIFALETADIFNLLCLPGIKDASTLIDAAAYCQTRRALLIVDADPAFTTPSQLSSLVKGSAVPKTDAAAIYGPWIQVGDPLNNGKLRKTAPSGSVAGLYARTDTNRGVWKAPAGTEANLVGAQGVDYVLTDAENGVLNPLGFNCIRNFPVYGVVAWGARTLKGADEIGSDYKYVPVRRLALFLEESLYRGTKWVVFEPNDEPLWSQIRLNIGAFMQNLFRQGAFQGKTPREAYFVKCDRETTTQNDINLGTVNIVVGFAPLKPAEFVIIQIQQMAGQISA